MTKTKTQSKRGIKKGAEYSTIGYHERFRELNKGVENVKTNTLVYLRHDRELLAGMYPGRICDRLGRFRYDIRDTPLIQDLFYNGCFHSAIIPITGIAYGWTAEMGATFVHIRTYPKIV